MEKKHFDNLELRIFNNLEELSKEAADIFVKESEKTLKTKEFFTVSLCGGSTPKRLFELLAADFKNVILWKSVHIFFGDEREKKENPESNFQIAYQLWLKEIIKETPLFKFSFRNFSNSEMNNENNIHRIKMELGLAEGAKEYEKEINRFAADGFDLSLNGAGSDGHRNGVFPESPQINWKNGIWDLQESAKVYGYKVPPEVNSHTERITLTPWFLNKSKVNILMISGREKADLLRKITLAKENYNKKELPAITFNGAPTIVLTDKLTTSKLL